MKLKEAFDQHDIPTFQQLWDMLPDEVEIPNWKRGDLPKRVNIKKELEDCIQAHKWHPEGSVKKHMELIYNQIIHNFSNDPHLPYLILALMFHDIAKPESTEISFKPDGSKKISSIGHEHIAIKYIDTIIHDYVKTLKINFPGLFRGVNGDIDLEMVKNMVKDHMKSHLYNAALRGESKPDNQIDLKKQKWIDFANSPHWPILKKFAHSDSNGRYVFLKDEDEAEESVEDHLGNRVGYIKKDYTE